MKYVYSEPSLKIDNTSKPIVFDLKSNIETNFYGKMVDSVELIELETTEESIFGAIKTIKYIEEKFFVVDHLKAMSIFVFDKHGRFLYKVGNIGKGPGEYSSIDQVQISDWGIFIFDWLSRKYIQYDLHGRFISERIIPFRVSEVIKMEGRNYIFQYRYYKRDKIKYRLSFVDSVFNEMNTALPFTNTRKFVPGSFVKSNNRYYYYYPLCDTIYEVNKEKIIPKFCLSLYKDGEIKNFLEKTKYLNQGVRF